MTEFCLDVRGDFACFSRPELKVERMSYDVITPSAARAIFDSIFWKPAIRWHVTEIEVMKPIRWTSVMRNELKGRATGKSVFIEDRRTQRTARILRDVRYRIHARLEMKPDSLRTDTPRDGESYGKYAAMFERRAVNGQYFHHPYLGCREFSCSDVRLVGKGDGTSMDKPIQESRDLGIMLYDLDYSSPRKVGKCLPMFFNAVMEDGRICTDERKVRILK